VVVGDAAYSSCLAPFVRDAAKLFLMPVPVAEQALVDSGAVAHGVPASLAPLASFIVLFGAVLLPICKVIEASIEHGPWDI
jgi:hypothetical protein